MSATNDAHDNAHDAALPALPPRDSAGHKGTFGSVLVIGGCAHSPRLMLGGVMLAARGALRAGTGRVIAAVPEPLAHEALLMLPEATVIALPVDEHGVLHASKAAEALDSAMIAASAIVVGPALGTSEAAGKVVMRLVALGNRPLVIDADAIRLFASHRDAARDLRGTAIFTPHGGEALALAQLLQLDIDLDSSPARARSATSLAQLLGAVVVLKGAGTVTSDGLNTWRCDRGNAALATGGSGDVLAGVVAAMLAQFSGKQAISAELSVGALAALAVEIHARAGDLWRDAHGDAGALAHEFADLIPQVMREMRAR
jgi:ADP-dependent NAD(P)H-hydrate dehydratase